MGETVLRRAEVPSMTTLKKTLWFLLASAVIAVGAFLLMDWSKLMEQTPFRETNDPWRIFALSGQPHRGVDQVAIARRFSSRPKNRSWRFDISLVKSRKTARPLTPVPGGEPAPTVATETNKARAANPGPARTIYAWADAVNGTAQLPKDYNSWGIGFDDRLDGGIKASVPLASVTPSGQGPLLVTFHLQAALPNKEFDTVEPGVATWNPEIRSTFLAAVGPLLYSALVFCGALGNDLPGGPPFETVAETTLNSVYGVESAETVCQPARRNLFCLGDRADQAGSLLRPEPHSGERWHSGWPCL